MNDKIEALRQISIFIHILFYNNKKLKKISFYISMKNNDIKILFLNK